MLSNIFYRIFNFGGRYMPRLFGTDGVRGVAGDTLSCQLAFDLGRAGAHVLISSAHKPRILIGQDTRISGQMLSSALAAGVCSVGAEAIILGVMPTPGVAFLTKQYNADAGIVVSASHNPMEYNGIKFFDSSGYKLPDTIEDEIEAHINDGCDKIPSATGGEIGRITYKNGAEDDYIDHLKNIVNVDLSNMNIALDSANGAVSHIAPMLFNSLGANIVSIFDQPNGTNINKGCGSTYIDTISSIVNDSHATVGFAFDGDADRCLAVDENGKFVDGDVLMLICAIDMKERCLLNHDTLVVTVMSNLGLTIAAKENNIRLESTKVGDRYVLERMRSGGYKIGGEQSGHIIFSDGNTTGDGLLTALSILSIMKRKGKTLGELADCMKVMPQVLLNIHVSEVNKHTWRENVEITRAIAIMEDKYGDAGRLLVRESGTEPLIRVMLEGEEKSKIQEDAEKLARIIRMELGEE